MLEEINVFIFFLELLIDFFLGGLVGFYVNVFRFKWVKFCVLYKCSVSVDFLELEFLNISIFVIVFYFYNLIEGVLFFCFICFEYWKVSFSWNIDVFIIFILKIFNLDVVKVFFIVFEWFVNNFISFSSGFCMFNIS